MAENIYVDGFRTFPKNQNAPDWILGSLLITIEDFTKFIENNKQYLTKYKDKDQLKVNITKSKDGQKIIFVLDTYKKESQPNTTNQEVINKESDFPF